MLNVNAITSTLAKMPDQALQRYAAMHKDDPYIMALAVSESNRRKEMRSAAQAPQGMVEMPKVTDQAVAEMAPQMQQPLPEDQGIARLPAGNMNFADGGIIAFGDGGDVEHYDGGGGTSAFSQFLRSTDSMQKYLNGTPAERAALESAYRTATQGPTRPIPAAAPAAAAPAGASALPSRAARMIGQTAVPAAVLEGGLAASKYAANKVAGMTPEQRAEYYSNPMVGALSGDTGLAAAIMNASSDPTSVGVPAGKKRAPSKEDLGPVPGTSDKTPLLGGRADARTGYVVNPGVSVPSTKKSLLGPEVPDEPAATGTAPAAAAAAPSVPGVNDLERVYQDILKKQDYKDPAADQVSGLQKLMKESADRRIKEFDEDVAKRGDIFKGREERLTKREAEIGKQREENTGMAFLNAGLAMMSTPGGLAMAIGKGARVGTEQFAAGLDKIRAAQDKMAEARDHLEELRINRDDLTAKERRGLTAAADTARIDAEKLGIDGVREAANVNRSTAKEIFGKTVELTKTQIEQQEQNKRNAATVAGGIKQAQIMAAARGDNDLPKLYETTRKNIATEATKKFPYDAVARAQYEQEAFAEAVRSNPALAQYASTAGGGGAPAAAATDRFNPATGKIEPMR
jgi:hypothetical protein